MSNILNKYFTFEFSKMLSLDIYQNIIEIDYSQINIFDKLYNELLNKNKKGELIITYRGDNENRLKEIYFKSLEEFDKKEFLSRIFFYGSKAKYFFENSVNTNSNVEISNINDTSDKLFISIFKEFNLIFEKNINYSYLDNFIIENISFVKYFRNNENIEDFIRYKRMVKNYINKIKLRDYYLYLLHNSEFRHLGSKSIFLSTTFNINKAIGFANINVISTINRGYVSIYFIPKPFYSFGVNQDILKDLFLHISKFPLPKYKSNFFPEEKEFAVKGALFPHFTIGIIDLKDNSFIINPYLFRNLGINDSYYKNGFNMDQPKWNDLIIGTNFKKFVTLSNNLTFSDRNIYI